MATRFALLLSLASLFAAVRVHAQAPAAPEQTLDQAIAYMKEARRNFTAVKDYTCTLVSRENVRGTLQEESVIQAKFRVQPNSVALRWIAPAKSAGQEVVWVDGKNSNKMKVHSRGLLKVAGWVSIDPRDPRAMEHSRHSIVESGLGNIIEESIRQWEREQGIGKTKVKIAEYTFDSRRCWRIEVIRTEQRAEFYAYRTVVYLDKESKLPIRNENYFFPKQGGAPEGELMESFSYVGLRFNVGVTDQDFTK